MKLILLRTLLILSRTHGRHTTSQDTVQSEQGQLPVVIGRAPFYPLRLLIRAITPIGRELKNALSVQRRASVYAVISAPWHPLHGRALTQRLLPEEAKDIGMHLIIAQRSEQ